MWSIKRTCFTIKWLGLIFLVQQVPPQYLQDPFIQVESWDWILVPLLYLQAPALSTPKVYLLCLLHCKYCSNVILHVNARESIINRLRYQFPYNLITELEFGTHLPHTHTRQFNVTQFTLMSCPIFLLGQYYFISCLYLQAKQAIWPDVGIKNSPVSPKLTLN